MSRHFWLNIPNLLTLGRILSVPVLVWLILIHELNWAFWLFILSGISDGLDGYLAKKLNAETRIGAILDPLADKLLLVSVFVILGVQEILPLWLVIMVSFRDLSIVVGAGLIEMLTRDLEIAPSLSSKINTIVQILLVSCVLGVHGLDVDGMAMVVQSLVFLTATTTVLSGIIYLYQWGARIGQLNGDA